MKWDYDILKLMVVSGATCGHKTNNLIWLPYYAEFSLAINLFLICNFYVYFSQMFQRCYFFEDFTMFLIASVV
jgi:hypothetical protein